MKNLDQIRAKNALDAANGNTFKGANDGEVVKKVPAMIRESGLLGALAFACEGKEEKNGVKLKNEGHNGVFRAIIKHLGDLGRLPGKTTDPEGFLANLCEADAASLRSVTAEAMAYLAFLRRFAKKSKTKDGEAE